MKLSACCVPILLMSVLMADDEIPSAASRGRVAAISQTLSLPTPIVIAHRGASGYLPEHTTESAAFAHALEADYIEQDVVLTKDSVAVVLHDVTLNSVSNVADVFPDRSRDGKYYVFDFTLSELKQLNVVERYESESRKRFPRGKGNFQIGTLKEHIELIQGLNRSRPHTAGLYVEIKQPALHQKNGLDPSKVILQTLADYGYKTSKDKVFLQCFEEPEVLRLRTELKCRLPLIQLLGNTPTAEEIAAISKVADGIGVKLTAVVSGAKNGKPQVTDVVAAAHEHALMVHVWTYRVDDLPEFAESPTKLLDWLVKDARVDGIFADHPDVALTWRKAAHARAELPGPFHLLKGGSSKKGATSN